jgi:hypothetical protein
MTVLNTIRRLLLGEEHQSLSQNPEDHAAFALWFEELEVGSLWLSEGRWRFTYTDDFRRQSSDARGVRPLADFPDIYKTYESPSLWPFFLARIPSTAQPEVRERIEHRGLDSHNAAQLLREFGERSISNAFLVRAAG